MLQSEFLFIFNVYTLKMCVLRLTTIQHLTT